MSTQSIVIIGGSFAGLGAAHFAFKHVLPQLPKKEGVTYNVTVINPSKQLFWRLGSPRASASKELFGPDKAFFDIEPSFTYAFPKFKLVQGKVTSVDAAAQTVAVQTTTGEEQTLPYAALVIATGFSTPSPLFTQTTDPAALEAVYDDFQAKLKNAKTIVIGGGGPVGVETAGEIAEVQNGVPGFFASAPKNPKTKVTLIAGGKKLLPILRPAIADAAEGMLKKLGCDVVYNVKVVSATKLEEGEFSKTKVELSDGKTIEADIYIDATGARPNTGFLPKEWLDERNKVAVNPKTLRVEHASAGSRIYAVGDVGSYTRGGALDMYDAIPVAMTNLRTDLIAHLGGSQPGGDRHYTANLKESQLCPIGTQKGVGAFNGFRIPSPMVWMIKGRDYMVGQLKDQVMRGDNFVKEGKWDPVPVANKVGLASG